MNAGCLHHRFEILNIRFRLFPGGYELKGDFSSAVASVNAFAFPGLKGSLLWEPHRFEVTRATAGFYGGDASFSYAIAPISAPTPAVARFDVTYRDVDLSQFSDAAILGIASSKLTVYLDTSS